MECEYLNIRIFVDILDIYIHKWVYVPSSTDKTSSIIIKYSFYGLQETVIMLTAATHKIPGGPNMSKCFLHQINDNAI